MLSSRVAWLALIMLALCAQTQVWADESTITPAQIAPTSNAPIVLPSTSDAVPAPAVSTTTTTIESTTVTKTAAPSDPMALLYCEKVAPGPFEAKRNLLLASIKAAKKQGFGITVYLNELNKVEDQIKLGTVTPQTEGRVDAIAEGLQDQLKRSQILKTQRPTGAVHSGGSVASESGGGRPRKSTDEMLQSLRAKYGDKLPAGLGGLSDGDLKEKLMNSDAAKEFLRKMNH